MGSQGETAISIFHTYSTMNSSSNGLGVYEEDHHDHPHNLSRLSMCSKPDEEDQEEMEEDDDSNDALSLESFSDSEQEPGYGCLSLPITPPRVGRSLPISIGNNAKQYASENEGKKQSRTKERNSRRRSSTFNRESLLEKCNLEKKKMEADAEEEEMMILNAITRPKEKRRSLGINVEEAKASRDLGFGLEIPSRLSVSCCPSPVWDREDTNSGEDSPISNWRISSPGDDPNAVKARLKIWAHAVAAASTSPSN